jgi:hypothetical protein
VLFARLAVTAVSKPVHELMAARIKADSAVRQAKS